MSTSGGINFLASRYTVRKMKRLLPELNKVVNEEGLGISCTPTIGCIDGVFYLAGQTHWSYDGTNGKELVKQIKLWAERHQLKIEIIDEYYA